MVVHKGLLPQDINKNLLTPSRMLYYLHFGRPDNNVILSPPPPRFRPNHQNSRNVYCPDKILNPRRCEGARKILPAKINEAVAQHARLTPLYAFC